MNFPLRLCPVLRPCSPLWQVLLSNLARLLVLLGSTFGSPSFPFGARACLDADWCLYSNPMLGPIRGFAGTGQTVSSLVERPIGTEIGEAIDELPPGLQSQAKSMQQLNYTETKAQAQIREAELKRLLKLQQGHNADAAFGGGAEAADPESPGDDRSKQRPGKRKRGGWPHVMSPGEHGNAYGEHYGHDTSRLKRIRANVARTVSRLKHDEFSDHSDDDDLLEEEGACVRTGDTGWVGQAQGGDPRGL